MSGQVTRILTREDRGTQADSSAFLSVAFVPAGFLPVVFALAALVPVPFTPAALVSAREVIP
jgi:hypothetical protein